MTISGIKPHLPKPSLQRWQPLRLGLVNLFHYDSEEFWFRDGHLLLRGNNGTGKSKVLSLTLPFLFDASLKSSRIEPDGDAGKKMSWNLLLGKYDRRMGYAWIEFGRLGNDGEPQYLTLGSGMSAAAARVQVDSWFFLLDEQRIGEDLWLTNQQRVVLTKERLKETIEGYGHVFETAINYRRAVDERLFQLGGVRYAALMDTLIQLRQPQLSKKPDETSLSNALTEALPPLSMELLEDVAEAMNQLEEDRRQLDEYEKLALAVAQFNTRYRIYAGMHSRRQARVLRSAQTVFDNASRDLKLARDALDIAKEAESESALRHEEADLAWQNHRARLEELQNDPAMQDATRMANVARDAEHRERDKNKSEKLLADATARIEQESVTTKERAGRVAVLEQDLAKLRAQQAATAQTAGIADSYEKNAFAILPAPQIAAMDAGEFDGARKDLRRFAESRRDQILTLRRRHDDVEQALQVQGQRLRVLDERREEKAEAAASREQADAEVEAQGEQLIKDWQLYIGGLHQLRIVDADTSIMELGAWVVGLDGDNPVAAALQAAQQEASVRLAASQADIEREQRENAAERDILEAERARLEAGEDAQPVKPPYRAADVRVDRPGAPLWKLVEFQDGLSESQQAGMEAALEASGLLDAWVAPDGRIQDTADGDLLQRPQHDTRLVQRPRVPDSLAKWLRPVNTDAPVSADIVEQMLESVAGGTTDNADSEAWISPNGSFRLGALAGAWNKPKATFIGFTARAAARKQRLEEIAARLIDLSTAEQKIRRQLEQNRLDQAQAAAEWRQAPSDSKLRAAHVQASVCARAYQLTTDKTERAEAEYREATERLRNAQELLAADATDLHLPSTLEELRQVDAALTAFNETLHDLVRTTSELRTAMPELIRQQEREKQAQNELEQWTQDVTDRRREFNEAQARLKLLRETVGVKVDELQQKLKDARVLTENAEKAREETIKAQLLTAQDRVRCEEKVTTFDADLQESVANRQEAIHTLQQFADTGLIEIAMPDVELPNRQTPWTIEPALNLARRIEQALSAVKDDNDSWHGIQNLISHDFTELQRALGALHHHAQAETTDYGMIVFIIYQNRPERPDRLGLRLGAEIAERRELLTAREREVLENHLQAEIAAAVQKLMQDAERQVDAINDELDKRPTSTGVKFSLQWLPLPEGSEGAPVGLEAARKRLLNTSSDLWSTEDRRVVGAMLQQRIAEERERAEAADGGSMLDQLAKALDYRRWHRFSVRRWQNGQWRKLSGPASSGERALGLTIPLFAAVASFYTQSGYAHAPRLVLLDEAFAGIDDDARAHCMGLIKEFDLDFVITSEREWACYAALPGVSIGHLLRREGIDAVHVSRWAWDGRAKRPQPDPNRRFAEK